MTLQYTNVEDIPDIVESLRTSFHERILDPLEFRVDQLKKLYTAIDTHSKELAEALQRDFNRATFETAIAEVNPALAELRDTIRSVRKWSKPQLVSANPYIPFALSSAKVQRIPLGTVLIIGPFNYPLVLSVSPLAGAIAAGNNVVLKPSELTPHFSAVLTRVLEASLSPRVLRVVNGGIDETTALLAQKYDKIMFTGSGKVGRIVSVAAAKHLTPVLLELGGKSPAVVSASLSSSQLETAAKRIAWAKYSNSGQTCVAVDYVLVDKRIHSRFVAALKRVVEEEFFKGLTSTSEKYTHIVNARGYERLVGLLSRTSGTLVTGGITDDEHNFISPTVYSGVAWDDALMEDELFGPILPVLEYDGLDTAIDSVVKHHDTPLASYIFSTDQQEISAFNTRIRSGATMVNDGLIYFANSALPFGGIGASGHGVYHGKASFDAFSHPKPVVVQRYWTEALLKLRYPPYNGANAAMATATFFPLGKSLRTQGALNYVGAGLLVAIFAALAANAERTTVLAGFVYLFFVQ